MSAAVAAASPARLDPDASWWGGVALMLALVPPTVAALFLDERLIGGESIWWKPLRFELSLAMHFATLALIASRLTGGRRAWWPLRAAAAASLAALGAEMVVIIWRAARGEASHFNVATPFDAMLYYGIMAGGAVLITLAAAAVGLAVAFDGQARLGSATRVGAVLGLVGGAILTLVTAFTMGGRLSHAVGPAIDGEVVMAFTGWSLSRGDLRVPHFLATHAMQALPLAGLALDRLRRPGAARLLIFLLAAGWGLLTWWLLLQMLAGEALVP